MTTANAIETHDLSRHYDDRIAVAHLEFNVVESTIACLLGPNGSGKTTTIAMLSTLRRPTAGTATVFGYDIVEQPELVRSVIGVTLQHTGVDDLMSGRETLEVQARLQGIHRALVGRRVDDVVELLDLGTHLDTRVGTWSGGLRRRLDLATALIHRPRMLFLDEATTGLDPASRRDLWDEIRRLNTEDGTTILMTTQYLDEAEHLAHAVSILRDGELVVSASPADLKASHGERTLVLDLGCHSGAVAAQRVLGGQSDESSPGELRIAIDSNGSPQYLMELARAGIEVSSLTISEPTLEDVFLSITSN